MSVSTSQLGVADYPILKRPMAYLWQVLCSLHIYRYKPKQFSGSGNSLCIYVNTIHKVHLYSKIDSERDREE